MEIARKIEGESAKMQFITLLKPCALDIFTLHINLKRFRWNIQNKFEGNFDEFPNIIWNAGKWQY